MAKIKTISVITDENYNLLNMTAYFNDETNETLAFTYDEDGNISKINEATVKWGDNSE